jgi:hypothetical protein
MIICHFGYSIKLPQKRRKKEKKRNQDHKRRNRQQRERDVYFFLKLSYMGLSPNLAKCSFI